MRFRVEYYRRGVGRFGGVLEADDWASALKQAQMMPGVDGIANIQYVDAGETVIAGRHVHGAHLQSPPGGVLDRTAEFDVRLGIIETWMRVTEARLNKLEEATRGEF